MTAQLPLYGAIYAALTANPSIGASVYDFVPQNAAYPHIEIGGGQALDWSAALMRGEQTTIEIHVWSRQRGRAEARELLGKIKDRLHEQALSLSGATFIDCRFRDMDGPFTDADGTTQHGVIRFTAWTTTAS
jgi:hypothetical protein